MLEENRLDEAAIPEHPRTADIEYDLARLLIARGQPAAADPLLRRSVAIITQTLGRDSTHLAPVLVSLAGVLADLGRASKAEPLLRQALANDTATLSAHSAEAGEDLLALGQLLARLGQLEGAVPLEARAIQVLAPLYGDGSPAIAQDLAILAVHLARLGRRQTAIDLLRPACAVLSRDAVLRGYHAATLEQAAERAVACQSALAQWLWSDGTTRGFDEAFAAVQRAQASSAADSLAKAGAAAVAGTAGGAAAARDYEEALIEIDRADLALASAMGRNGEGDGKTDLAALQATRERAGQRLNATAALLRRQAPAFWDLRSPDPVPLAELQTGDRRDGALLGENEALVVWHIPPGAQHGQVFAISRHAAAWAGSGWASATSLRSRP